MSDELDKQAGDQNQEPVVPESNDYPEKFWGKPLTEVIRSYKEAEKKIKETSEEANQLKEELGKLQDLASQDTPEDTPEEMPNEELTEYEYLTKAEIKRIMKERDKKEEEKLQEVEQRAVSKVMAQIEKRQFIDNHPELFDGKDENQVNDIIKKFASVGFAAGAQSLEGAYKAVGELAESIGLASPNANENLRPIPSNMNGSPGNEPETNDELERMIKFHKQNAGGLSGKIKY